MKRTTLIIFAIATVFVLAGLIAWSVKAQQPASVPAPAHAKLPWTPGCAAFNSPILCRGDTFSTV